VQCNISVSSGSLAGDKWEKSHAIGDAAGR
jgi:hypothetical protein